MKCMVCAACGSRMLQNCIACLVPCSDTLLSQLAQVELEQLQELEYNFWIIHPKWVISDDWSGGACWSAAFHNITYRCACKTCSKRLADVGGKAMIFVAFFFLVNSLK